MINIKIKKSFLVLPLILFLTLFNSNFEKITVSKGQNTPAGISAKAEIRAVNAQNTHQLYVIPSGEAIGVKLYTDGVLVTGSEAFTDGGGKLCEPAKKAGIRAGDRIIAVNGQSVSDSAELKKLINSADGHITLSVIRNGELLQLPVDAVYSDTANAYLIGLWVRDSAAGIGTLTFYNPANSTFAALGHGICDCDTGALLKLKSGSVGFCRIKGVKKSENGSPGEILGEFAAKKEGSLLLNTDAGIYGEAFRLPDFTPVPVASRFEVKTGAAEILCDIDGSGPAAYRIEITKISTSARESGKSFIFKIRDSGLMQKTGGIVQGMSGSPVLQGGRLIGAVTHVFVSDTSRGYGIFAENMLDMTNMLR